MLDVLIAASMALLDPGTAAVKLGVDVLLDGDAALSAVLKGKRVGLVTNPSGVDGKLVMTADRLANDGRFTLVQLYGPEHGIRGDVYAGDSVSDSLDPRTGVPVESLYGKSRRPSKESLAKLDVLLFDVQDVGSRTYTYISTLGEAMHAAAEAKKPIVVLDRPNPLGGVHFEGPVMQDEWKSFIGWSRMPVTHGMTVGEVARFYQGELKIACELHVVPMEGWTREMVWDDTGLEWVQTSPHIPHASSAYCYVATGMIGGITDNVNEGVGYTLPFETLAAEFLDAGAFAEAMNAAKLPGVRFTPIAYQPFYQRHQGKPLRGVRLVIDDPREFLPVRTSLTLMATLEKKHPGKVKYQEGRAFNTHWGAPDVLERSRKGETAESILAAHASELAEFGKLRAKYLLYR